MPGYERPEPRWQTHSIMNRNDAKAQKALNFFALAIGHPFCEASRPSHMLDRQKLEVILARRFPGVSPAEIAAAANSIMGLEDDWEVVDAPTQDEIHHHFSVQCGDYCSLSSLAGEQTEFRVLRRRVR